MVGWSEAWLNGWVFGWFYRWATSWHGWIEGWISGWVSGWQAEWMYVSMHYCTGYVCFDRWTKYCMTEWVDGLNMNWILSSMNIVDVCQDGIYLSVCLTGFQGRWMNGRKDVYIGKCMDDWISGWGWVASRLHTVCMHGWMDYYMDGWMGGSKGIS